MIGVVGSDTGSVLVLRAARLAHLDAIRKRRRSWLFFDGVFTRRQVFGTPAIDVSLSHSPISKNFKISNCPEATLTTVLG